MSKVTVDRPTRAERRRLFWHQHGKYMLCIFLGLWAMIFGILTLMDVAAKDTRERQRRLVEQQYQQKLEYQARMHRLLRQKLERGE